jgi:colanic acid/amylovoran biosynthesis protein
MKICITNCTGTRNRGCEALVQCLIDGLTTEFGAESLEITLHTNDPLYDAKVIRGAGRVYFSYPMSTPNHLSYRFLNTTAYRLARLGEKLLPTHVGHVYTHSMSAASKSDFILPTGGDLFTSDYGHLRKQFTYCSLNKKTILLGHTIGPFNRSDERYFVRGARSFMGIAVRERESYDYLTSLKLDIPVRLCADLAFVLAPADRRHCEMLLENMWPGLEHPLVGISISQGIIRYSGLDENKYFSDFAGFVDLLHAAGRQVLLIPHVQERNPNNNDWYPCHEVWKRVRDKKRCVIAAGEFSAAEYKGLIGLCECLIGTRTHPTIASLSQKIPTVAIAYSRKAGSIFKDIFGEGTARQLVLKATELSPDRLLTAYRHSLENRISDEVLSVMKRKAGENISFFKELTQNVH